jgi:predicted outer membrane repeat protein
VSIIGASPTFDGCLFSRCGSRGAANPGNGGAVAVSGASARPRFLRCRFQDNYANFGGAIHVEAGSLEVQGCEFQRNDGAPGTGQGGALYLLSTLPSLLADTLMANSEPRRCRPPRGHTLPALWVHAGSLGASACCDGATPRTSLRVHGPGPLLPSPTATHSPNPPTGSVGFSGGALSAQLAAEVRVERCRFADNRSGTFAGAALVWGSNMTALDSELANVRTHMGLCAGLLRYSRQHGSKGRCQPASQRILPCMHRPPFFPKLPAASPQPALPWFVSGD